MSITPMPDLPPAPEGIHLSAIDSYIGQPASLPGVSFWPRVGARIIDLIVHYLVAICAGFLFGFLLAIVQPCSIPPCILCLYTSRPAV
jgi:hypothetical protein